DLVAQNITGSSAQFSGNLNVTGTTLLGGLITANSGLSLSGALTGNSGASFAGGACTISNTGNVLAGNLSLNGALSVTGAATFRSAIAASNGLSLSGALTVTGATTVNGSLTANNGLAVTGNLTGTTSVFSGAITAKLFNVISSRRSKHAIEKLEVDHDKMLALNPVSFIYNNDEEKRVRYGFIAEEIEPLFSHFVSHNEQGETLAVNYIEFIPLLVGAVQ